MSIIRKIRSMISKTKQEPIKYRCYACDHSNYGPFFDCERCETRFCSECYFENGIDLRAFCDSYKCSKVLTQEINKVVGVKNISSLIASYC